MRGRVLRACWAAMFAGSNSRALRANAWASVELARGQGSECQIGINRCGGRPDVEGLLELGAGIGGASSPRILDAQIQCASRKSGSIWIAFSSLAMALEDVVRVRELLRFVSRANRFLRNRVLEIAQRYDDGNRLRFWALRQTKGNMSRAKSWHWLTADTVAVT